MNAILFSFLRITVVMVQMILLISLSTSIDIVDIGTKGNGGSFTSLVLDTDGNPRISYYDNDSQNLNLAVCDSPSCENITTTILDEIGDVGIYNSMTLDRAGMPVISYQDYSNGDLKLISCHDEACSDREISIVDSIGSVGAFSSLLLDGTGKPLISYQDQMGISRLKFAYCESEACFTPIITVLDYSDGGTSVLRSNNLPIIAYYDSVNGRIKLAFCDNSECSDYVIRELEGIEGSSYQISIQLDENDRPIISYQVIKSYVSTLMLAICEDPLCERYVNITIDDEGDAGWSNSLILSNEGLPIISYYDFTTRQLKLATCFDRLCQNKTITNIEAVDSFIEDTDISVRDDGTIVLAFDDGDILRLAFIKDIIAPETMSPPATEIAVNTSDPIVTPESNNSDTFPWKWVLILFVGSGMILLSVFVASLLRRNRMIG